MTARAERLRLCVACQNGERSGQTSGELYLTIDLEATDRGFGSGSVSIHRLIRRELCHDLVGKRRNLV
jgi:hypothetical protein